MEDLKKQLEGEFTGRLEQLGAADLGTEEYKSAMDSMTKMADRIIEIEKVEIDRELKVQHQADEWAIKEQQLKAEKKDRIVKYVLEGGKIVVTTAVGIWAFVASMNFEKEGTLTTQGGRKALDGLLKLFKH